MFSSMLVSLFVSRITVGKNYSNDFHKIHWKGVTLTVYEIIRFWS